jgi:hypothetical protein
MNTSLETPYSSTVRELKICYVNVNTFYTKNNIFKHVAQPIGSRKESAGINLIIELHVVYYTNQVVELNIRVH